MSNCNRNTDEGADPASDLRQQNPDRNTTEDLSQDGDSASDDTQFDDGDQASKTEHLTNAGRDDMDSNAGTQ